VNDSPATFDEERAAAYDERIRRLAPGYDVLHDALASVAGSLLGDDAHVLVVGAGTGTEIVRLAQVRPGWRFIAVDPSTEMLDQCRKRIEAEELGPRVEYRCDRVEALSEVSRFDAATSMFVAHFIQDRDAKRRFFRAVARRLQPRAPFLLADLYKCSSGEALEQLTAAWRRAVRRAGMDAEVVENAFDRMERQIDFVPEDELARILDETGFSAPTRFYQCFLWGAWWSQKQ
jgi:tRNA (cmo5U34)-methyltransferase